MSLPIQNVGYGLTNALQPLAPEGVISNRNPTTNDKGYELTTIWDNKSTNTAFILTSVVAGVATWVPVNQAAGFSPTNPLVVSAVGAGTATTSNAYAIANVPYGQIAITGTPALTAGTGIINLTVSNSLVTTGSTAVISTASILDNSGNHAAMAVTGTIQSAGQLVFQITNLGAGAPGANDVIYLNFQLPPKPTYLSATTSATLNAQNGILIITGKTTAAAANFTVTLTNSYITTTSPLFVSASNLNASGGGASCGILDVIQASGSAVITVINNGAGALGTGDNVLISFYVPQLQSTSTGTTGTRTIQSTNALAFVTGLTTAQNATITFTITDAYVLANSALMINATSLNASTNGASLGNTGLYQTAGSFVFVATNNGSGSLGSGDNVLLTFNVLS